MKRIRALSLCVALVVFLVGCAPQASNTQRGAGYGALTGAGVGALMGQIIGGDTKSTLIGMAVGAAAGAMVGAMIGHYMDRQERTAIETARVYDYQPTQGSMLKLENVRVDPETITPGQPSKLVMTYALMEPNPDRAVPVTERRQIISGQEMLKEIGPKTVDRVPGTYYSEQEVTFPKNLPEGTYAMKGVVEASGQSSQQDAYFRVAHVPTDSGYAYLIEMVDTPQN
jgi:surface antigen